MCGNSVYESVKYLIDPVLGIEYIMSFIKMLSFDECNFNGFISCIAYQDNQCSSCCVVCVCKRVYMDLLQHYLAIYDVALLYANNDWSLNWSTDLKRRATRATDKIRSADYKYCTTHHNSTSYTTLEHCF